VADIIIRKNVRGPQRYRVEMLKSKVVVMQSRYFHRRGNAVALARRLVNSIKQGVTFHE
jgi:hypothetical protein